MPGRTSRRSVTGGPLRPWETPAASLLALALAAAVTWPLLVSPGSGAHDRTDTLFNTWLLAWNLHAASTLDNPLHPPIYLGQFDAAGRSDLLLPQSLAAAPFRLAGAGPLAAHNLVLVISIAFAGLAVFLLAREAGLDTAGSLFACGAFVCCPFVQSHLRHLQLQSTGFAILGIRQALAGMRGGRLWPVGALLLLQFTASIYYGIFLDLALLLALPWMFRRQGRNALLYAGWILVGNLFALPLLSDAMYAARAWPVDSMAVSDASSFVSPEAASRLLGWLRPPTTHGEAALWPGLAAVAGSAAWLLRKDRTQTLAAGWFLAALCAVFAVLSLGPALVAFGRQVCPAPWRLLASIPGFSSMRLPARGGFLFLVPVMLAGGASMRGRPALAAAGILLSLAEVWPGPMRLEHVQPRPCDAWLAGRRFSAIAILPAGCGMDQAEVECGRLFGSTLHFTPMANGWCPSLPEGYPGTAALLDSWPSPAADSLLRRLRIECVILEGRVAEGADMVWTEGAPACAFVIPRPAS